MELNHNQKSVLCGISAYPDYNDREIAEVLGMNRSTVTAARHFLLKNKLYKTFLFPNFEKTGTKVMAVKYGDYDKLIPISRKKRMELLPSEIKIKENVFSISSEFKGLSLLYAPELYPIKDKIDAWNVLFESIDPNIQIRDIYIPKQMITAFKFMELQECLAVALGIKPLPPLKEKPGRKKQLSKKEKPLSRKEKRVLLSWMEKPSATNAQVAKTAGVSRAVVGLIKKRLLNSNSVQMIHLPKWPLLGLNLGVVMYLRLKPDNSSIVKEIVKSPEVIFLLSSAYEVILFAVFQNYDDYHHRLFPLLEKLKHEKNFTQEPKELLFPLDETAFTIDAYPALKQAFS